MSSSVVRKVINVQEEWFENRQSRIEQGSPMDLLAHARALHLVTSNRNFRGQGKTGGGSAQRSVNNNNNEEAE